MGNRYESIHARWTMDLNLPSNLLEDRRSEEWRNGISNLLLPKPY